MQNSQALSQLIQGTLHLQDIETGSLLAIMDSTYVTAVRTGLAGAIAADVLARSDADTVAIIGAGLQCSAENWHWMHVGFSRLAA